jgi:hypothetical protein
MNNDLVPLQILSASVVVGTETEGWTLDAEVTEESEPRFFSVEIYFSAPFLSPPVVHLGLTGFDTDQCSSSRLMVVAEQVSEEGFVARIETWRSSRVYSVALNWLAVGM